jgi:hypothetical protein
MELSQEELSSSALEAEMLHHVNKLKHCQREMKKAAEWLEKNNLYRLHPIAVDYIVESALSLAEESRRIAERALEIGLKATKH